VPEARLLKLNEAGFAKRRQLLEQQTKKNRPAGATSPTPGSAKGKEKAKKGENSKKRPREFSTIDNVSAAPFSLGKWSAHVPGGGLPEETRGQDRHSGYPQTAAGG
jgi:mortality factor 4-like protein 1